MLNKTVHFLLIILFITIPIINSHLLDLLGLENYGKYFWVDGNYEFTKVIYFNIFSGIILFLYILGTIIGIHPLSGSFFEKGRKLFISKTIYLIIGILITSTLFSISPYISLFGNADKSHSLLMFSNLIGIYIILQNSKKCFLQELIKFTSFGLFIIICFAIWQYYFPIFDYGDLSNRAIGTFGHPNYLALYLLLFLPIFLNKQIYSNYSKQKYKLLNIIQISLIIFTIFITKSLFGIIILLGYFLYITLQNIKINKKIIFSILISIFTIGIFFILKEFSFEKLDSFLSRIYIWDSTVNIISNDLKIFFVGNGLETLGNIFDNFKSPYLYIFENFGFTADRPHNIFLNIFYHTGFFSLLIFLYLIFRLIFKKSGIYKNALVLAFIFLLFNYASIASYLIIILFVSLLISSPKKLNHNSILNSFSYLRERGYIFKYILIFLITSFSIFGAYNSYKFYKSEIYIYNGNYIKAQKIYKNSTEDFNNINCNNLKIKSVENYFYCGDIFWQDDKQKAKIFYNSGLKKLPNLWNPKSKYFDNLFIKNNPQILHRFFSPKYTNLNIILKKIGIKK